MFIPEFLQWKAKGWSTRPQKNRFLRIALLSIIFKWILGATLQEWDLHFWYVRKLAFLKKTNEYTQTQRPKELVQDIKLDWESSWKHDEKLG